MPAIESKRAIPLHGRVVFAVPGHPRIGERSVPLVEAKAREAGIPTVVLDAISFIDAAVAALEIDPLADGVQIVDAEALAATLDREPYAGGLFGIDLVGRVKVYRLDPSWSLMLMVEDARRLHISIAEGLWLRIVDLEAALRARDLNAGESAVLEVSDAAYERNAGRWRVGDEIRRADEAADVAIDTWDLASVYLGTYPFEQLALAGRARELREGGLARATALFATPVPPWCVDGF